MALLRLLDLPPDALEALEAACEAESMLHSERAAVIAAKRRLPDSKAARIDSLLAQGFAISDIARQVGVSKSTVHARAKTQRG